MAIRKDEHGGVSLDGTHGISVNTSTQTRDQERASIIALTTRCVGNLAIGERIFALSEAHRQLFVFTSPGLLLSWMPGHSGFRRACSYGRDPRGGLCVVL